MECENRNMNDQEIVDGCIAQEKEAWDAFVNRFSPVIYSAVKGTLNRSVLAARNELLHDAFQEVFSRLLEKELLSTLKNLNQIDGYLRIVACRITLDKIKAVVRAETKQCGVEETDSELLQSGQEAGGNENLKNEQKDIVEKILSALNPKHRACIELHYMDGKTHEEISTLLGFPLSTVSTIIRRTKEKLRELFSHRGLGIDG